MSEQLKPCPFCGSTNIDPAEWSQNDGKTGPGCSDCGALGESIEAWNCRPISAPTAAERRSIDTPEFRQMLWTLWDEESSVAAFDGPLSHVNRIIAHIDTWAARSAAEAVPAGFKLVPIEPTQQMLDEVMRKTGNRGAKVWEIMLAAVPDNTALLSVLPTEAETVVVDVEKSERKEK